MNIFLKALVWFILRFGHETGENPSDEVEKDRRGRRIGWRKVEPTTAIVDRMSHLEER